MVKPLRTVAFTNAFLAQAKDEGVTEGEMARLVQLLAETPDAGDLFVGSGGCRKVRLARKGWSKAVAAPVASRALPKGTRHEAR